MGWRDYKDHQNSLNTQSDQGQAFNAAQGIAEIQTLVEEFRRHESHGGCWDWVNTNLADKWRLLMAAMNRIDTAFQEQCPGDLTQAVASARKLHQECVTAWGKRDG